MGETGWSDVSVKKVISCVNVAEFTSPSDVWDEDCLNLCGSGHCDTDSDSSFVDLSVDDLNLEGWVASKNFIGGYFKSVQES